MEALLYGLLAGLGTCLGAVTVLMFGRPRDTVLAILLGFAAGVMAAVVFLDLLPSATNYGNFITVLSGFLTGVVLIAAVDIMFNATSRHISSKNNNYLQLGYLVATGIALHDLPEGLSIAAGFATASKLGPLLALAIGLHNIPEGMATAAPLWAGGLRRQKILSINLLVSLVTPLGTFLGLVLLSVSPFFVAFLLAFAAGAMSYIVAIKLLPESFRAGRTFSFLGFTTGLSFVVFLTLFFIF